MPPELVIFVGLQGSGKSTLFRERFAGTHRHISKDLMPRSADKRRRQRRLVDLALATGESIVVDNTHSTRADRAELVAQGRVHGARIVCYFLDAPLGDCLRRNALREGAARIPDVAIFATRSKLEPPSLDEGYDELFTARLDDERGAFDIHRVRPPA